MDGPSFPSNDTVFLEFLQDDFSSGPAVFGDCMHVPKTIRFYTLARKLSCGLNSLVPGNSVKGCKDR